MRDLLKKRADICKFDIQKNCPLHYCFMMFQKNPTEATKIAQLLLEYGANPNQTNDMGWAPLHLAVQRGCLEAVKFAVDYNNKLL